ncbi:serine hydrolase domain-containing protein [Kordiimonas sp.]|uniref:serine hydrolase domain-containing protein n=1 Tax=Kordiimonas sp. TaxID=1970157 RepID=UPI003A8DA01F
MANRIMVFPGVRRFVSAAVVLAASLMIGMASAQDVNDQPVATADEPLEAFIEREMREKMEEFKVVGATIALVRDGEMIYAKGFGDADTENGIKVTARDTLFRWGSISKTFTWTAIMQLVEQGKVSLDADVNDYLVDVKITEAFGAPIRLKHLLAHTPGFEDEGLGHLFEVDPGKVLPLKDYLIRYQPKRVRPAGQVFAYSNYATALAGQIIANVSGMPYENYIEDNIFKPLGMNDSTFREPLLERSPGRIDPDLLSRVSKGFVADEDGIRQNNKFTLISGVGPAGAISSTATDMAKFLLAHMLGCTLGEVRLMKPETCATMHSALTPLNASGTVNNYHGFFQHRKIGAHNRIGHNGGTIHFHSQMGWYPELQFGFLMSTNTTTGAKLYKHMEEAIVTRLFGDKTVTPEPISPAADFASRADKYVGYYQNTRRNYSSIEVLNSLFMGSSKVTSDEDGYLILHLDSGPVKAAEVKPNLFRAVDKEDYYEFVENDAGDVIYLKALRSYDKVSWYQAPENRLILIVATFVFLFIGALVLLVRSMRRIAKDDPLTVKKARRRILASLLLWVAFPVTLGLAILGTIQRGELLQEFPSPMAVAALGISVFAAVFSVVPTWSVISMWREGVWGPVWRGYCTLLVVAVWLFVLQLHAIHLIGFNYTS